MTDGGRPTGETVDGTARYSLGGIAAEDVIAAVMARALRASCGPGGRPDAERAAFAWDVGNALKYLLRLGAKDSLAVEVAKAENYLHHARTGRWMR